MQSKLSTYSRATVIQGAELDSSKSGCWVAVCRLKDAKAGKSKQNVIEVSNTEESVNAKRSMIQQQSCFLIDDKVAERFSGPMPQRGAGSRKLRYGRIRAESLERPVLGSNAAHHGSCCIG